MQQLSHQKHLKTLWYSLPVILILSIIWLTQSPIFDAHPNQLSFAVTIDLLITIPFIYFLIIRKKSIPKTTVVLAIGIGVLIASIILPKTHQAPLSFVKLWILPFVELFVVIYVIYSVRKSVKAFKKAKIGHYDFFTNLKNALGGIMPKKMVGFIAMEIGAFYYAFLSWKKHQFIANEYSYHKESGTRAVLLVSLFLIAIETVVFHILLQNWSLIFAWVLSILSVYSGFQILGILKSLSQRPITIQQHKINLRYGIIAEGEIPIQQIKSIREFKGEITDNQKDIQSFSPFGNLEGHNVLIELYEPFYYHAFYGFKKKGKNIAFFIDDPILFISEVKMQIEIKNDI